MAIIVQKVKKKKSKSNEFLLCMDNENSSWHIIPRQDKKPYLEPKLLEALSLLMARKQLTSTDLASLLEDQEDISTKNARLRLEKLFNLRLAKKSKGEGKEFIYSSLI